jgi:uncharacterized protein YbjT (DUF2867 family)
MENILIAGSTGYLGKYIVKEALNQNLSFKAIARNPQKLDELGLSPNQIIRAEVTKPATLKGSCEGIDVVISTVGITRQKDGLTYMDVDYQANKNLLEEALKSGVKKFVYVSVLHGSALTHLSICKAKEQFVSELKQSGLDYCIVRPSGFFSDMKEFYEMAKSGRIYLFGDGNFRVNPIHGADLAKVCLDARSRSIKDLEVGGPEVLTHQEIAQIAFEVANKPEKLSKIPDWVRRTLLKLGALFMNKKQFGPVEFFLNVMAMDMATQRFGKHTLRSFFQQLRTEN